MTKQIDENALLTYNSKASHVALGHSALDLINNLGDLENDKLHRLFTSTVEAERAMFVVRGAIAFEIVTRAQEAGQQFDKTKGNGIDSLLKEISNEVGIDYRTLYRDYVVFKEFGESLKSKLRIAPETIMPREFYVEATKTSALCQETPLTIVEYFEEQREVTGAYPTDFARRDIKLFNEGVPLEEVKQRDSEQRLEAVATPASEKPPKLTERMMQLPIPETAESIAYARLVLDKYASFGTHWLRKCKEEFGEIGEVA